MESNSFSFRHIIWDWNGTLLDDKWLCIQSINVLLRARNLPEIDEVTYARIFRFPVKDYYEAAGFDFRSEPFHVPAMEFIDLYNERKKECRLHAGALELLGWFSTRGCRQYLLSASETGVLQEMTDHFGISGYFERIMGLDNHYAHGKTDLGKELLAEIHDEPSSVVMIGDTCHDQEVADFLGISAILCTHGHFPAHRLDRCGRSIFRNLEDLAGSLSGR